jgi:dTDP-4-amino-4,6-dideoxygalactose transaminase
LKKNINTQGFNKNLKNVVTPPVAPGATHVYHQYTIRITDQDRNKFAEEIGKLGVGSGVYYPIPNHRLPSYHLNLDLPATEQIAKECLSIPVHPNLKRRDLEKIVNVINKVASAGS